ncbi:MAG: 5'/3'-nucleotidase SurE, partial [Treponema sp.]|nr:5'/3'-nucleotidase SurE [Treponema sp.]
MRLKPVETPGISGCFNKMNILATNDDGIQCEGILRLIEMFRGQGHHVLAVVPDRNRSGASHSITFGASLSLARIDDNTYTYGGSPVDCVLVALTPGGLSYRPDMIISGINAGPNLGTDILYSGTAAAARQGSLYDIPSIAFSVYGAAPYCFEEAARWSAVHLEELSGLWRLDTFINVNYPNTSRLSDYVVTYPLPRIYEDIIYMEENADGSKICCM